MRHQRDQRPHDIGPGTNGNDGNAHRQSQLDIAIPGVGSGRRHNTQEDTQKETAEEFAAKHAENIGKTNIPHRQPANDGRNRLRSGIATCADEQGNVER